MLNNDFNPYSFAFINLKNLAHNLKIIKSMVQKQTSVLIPVKSNAYGCGLVPISRFLDDKINYFGTAFPFEAFILRKNKIKSPILVFNEVIYKEDFENIIKFRITPTVYTIHSLNKFNQLGKKYKKNINIHINVDTGMGRNGVPYHDIFSFLKQASSMNHIRIEGIYTHLSSADEKTRTFTLSQLKKFDTTVSFIKENKIKVQYFHVLNSAGLIKYPEFCYNMIRPGIMFYGYFPDNIRKKSINIKPCMNLKAKILYSKKVKQKTPISYAHTYYSHNNENIAVIGVGYGDGINRLLSNNNSVLYKDKICPIRGRICMDQFMIDTGQNIVPKQNDLITIFGRDHKKEIRIEDIAKKLKTIPYEILCQIGERVQRIYLK